MLGDNFFYCAKDYVLRGKKSFKSVSSTQQINLLEAAIDDLKMHELLFEVEKLENKQLLGLVLKALLTEGNAEDLVKYMNKHREILKSKLFDSSLTAKCQDEFDDVVAICGSEYSYIKENNHYSFA